MGVSRVEAHVREDLVKTISQLWRAKSNRSEYISIDEVIPVMEARGYEISKGVLAQMMKQEAAARGWEWIEGSQDAVQVLPN